MKTLNRIDWDILRQKYYNEYKNPTFVYESPMEQFDWFKRELQNNVDELQNMKTAEEFAKEIYGVDDNGIDISELNIPLSSAINMMNQYTVYFNQEKFKNDNIFSE